MADHDHYALLVADIFHAAGELRRSGEAIAGEAGQTQARWQVMSVVSDGDWTVPDVARRLGVARQGVQRIADELAADGLAHFETNPKHRRSPHVRLTAEGRRTLAQITALARRHNQKIVKLFTAGELDAARGILRRIVAALA